MIWIIGGTTETRAFLQKIKENSAYIVTVTTPEGKAFLADPHVLVRRLDYPAMLEFIQTNSIDTVVDLSHPYAVDVSRNARRACRENHIRYFRFVRPESEQTKATLVSSLDECLALLKTVNGCVFFTTGSKYIQDFERVRGENRFVYRILPTPASIEACSNAHIKLHDIVAMMGPFSEELNMAMFQEYHAEYVIMKNSGAAGGTPEKVNACLCLGITPVIIGRHDENGISNLETLVKLVYEKK